MTTAEISGYAIALIQASWVTLELAFVSLMMGLVLTLVFTLGERSRVPFIAWPTTTLVTLIRGLPELLVVLFIYFGAAQAIFLLTGQYVQVSGFLSGCIALSLIFASYGSQTLRGGLLAVSTGQKEAAKALGLSKRHIFLYIILPQALRHALPGLSNQWLVLLKDTALVSLIGINELLLQAQAAQAATHQGFTWYTGAALIYLIITLLSKQGIQWLEKSLQHPEGAS